MQSNRQQESLPAAGRHWLAWTVRRQPDLRARVLESAWIHETEQGSWRILGRRDEPVLATPNHLWALQHDCWDHTGHQQNDCRWMQRNGQPAHEPEGSSQRNLIDGASRPMTTAPRELRVPSSARLPIERVMDLRVDDVVRPDMPRELSSLGPYVLWGHSFGFAAVSNPESVLAVQDVGTGAWVPLFDPGEWNRMLVATQDEALQRFRLHPALQDANSRLIEAEQVRFERLELQFLDDGRPQLRAYLAATFCCRRSCSIGPLEPFAQELPFELEGLPRRWRPWIATPAPVREYFATFDVDERRGWSQVRSQGDALVRAHAAFLRD